MKLFLRKTLWEDLQLRWKLHHKRFFWYPVSFRIQSEFGEMQSRRTPNTDTLYAVNIISLSTNCYGREEWNHEGFSPLFYKILHLNVFYNALIFDDKLLSTKFRLSQPCLLSLYKMQWIRSFLLLEIDEFLSLNIGVTVQIRDIEEPNKIRIWIHFI